MELKFYKLPFFTDPYILMVYDSDLNFMFEFENEDDKGNREVVNKLIDRGRNDIGLKWNLKICEHDHTVILKDGMPFINIRGWGNLTSKGGHNLTTKEAYEVQDNLRDWLIYKLNKKK